MIWAIIFFSLAGLAGWGMWVFICHYTCTDKEEEEIIRRTQPKHMRDKMKKK